MAGGRRNVSKTSNVRSHFSNVSDDTRFKSTDQNSLSSKNLCPKHVSIPSVSQDSTLFFEFYMFLFTTLATFLQFLHLYRSIWWLPQSYSRYTMNFYLIDPYLVSFILLILGRRLIHIVFKELIERLAPPSLAPNLIKLMTNIMLALVIGILLFCAFFILQNNSIINVFFLCYPISVYFVLFGLSVTPFFDIDGTLNDKSSLPLGKPIHNCSTCPDVIRKEVETLKSDFNAKMKQTLFQSVMSAYYAGFVPCCFAQTQLFYDSTWVTQHMVLVWLGCFTMHCAHCYPPSYIDMLHRAALHLGRWWKVQWRNQHIPTHIWDENTLWNHGQLVRHCKDLYKAEGVAIAAEPGNAMHGRFYILFCNPAALLIIVLGLQVSLVVVQLFILIRAYEWHKLLSVALLLLSNYIIFFRLLRNSLLCWKVHKAEVLIHEKMSS